MDPEHLANLAAEAANNARMAAARLEPRPKVLTLCGSSRFPEAFAIANAHLSMLGYVVISLGLFGHADEPMGSKFLVSDGIETSEAKQRLDQLHFRKIDISDGIFVVNVGGYVGSSTKREIEYAKKAGKAVTYMFPPEWEGRSLH